MGECVVLERVFGRGLPCAQTCSRRDFPSYHEGEELKGCWTAHTALCMLEASRVKEDVMRILERRGLRWNTLLLALFLHDSGKLSKEYIVKGKPRIRHNAASAQIAYEALKRLNERGLVSDLEIGVMSRACYLHMEYYMWKAMEWGAYTTIGQVETPNMPFELADNVARPLENLRLILDESGVLDETISSAISEVSGVKKLKITPSRYSVSGSMRRDMLLKTMALQWLILLFDNRASSARMGVNLYWSVRLQNARKSISKEGAERVVDLSDRLLRILSGRLTPLPRWTHETS